MCMTGRVAHGLPFHQSFDKPTAIYERTRVTMEHIQPRPQMCHTARQFTQDCRHWRSNELLKGETERSVADGTGLQLSPRPLLYRRTKIVPTPSFRTLRAGAGSP